MHYKGKVEDPVKVARDLNVRFLLEGSVRKNPNTVKVAVKLIDTTTREIIWGEQYRPDLTSHNLIATQERIAHMITAEIGNTYGIIYF